jgi:PPPDE putative peptidase domain
MFQELLKPDLYTPVLCGSVHGRAWIFGCNEMQQYEILNHTTSGSTAGARQDMFCNSQVIACAVSFRRSIYVGDTYYTADELEDLMAHMGREYLGRRYHLLQTNCNSFTSDACFALCGERPPAWINRLAGVAMAVHCLCPTSWVPRLQPPSMLPNFDGTPPFFVVCEIVHSILCDT